MKCSDIVLPSHFLQHCTVLSCTIFNNLGTSTLRDAAPTEDNKEWSWRGWNS